MASLLPALSFPGVAAFPFTTFLLPDVLVRRGSEIEDGVRESVIDITHFCSNEIGAARCKNAFARVAILLTIQKCLSVTVLVLVILFILSIKS